VAEGVGRRFEVAVFVVGGFGFAAERVGDLDRPALGVEFRFRFEFGGFGAFFVPPRADRCDRMAVFVVGRGRLVACGIDFGFDVAVGVVFEFGFPAERVGC
jgi:hypothetical protein